MTTSSSSFQLEHLHGAFQLFEDDEKKTVFAHPKIRPRSHSFTQLKNWISWISRSAINFMVRHTEIVINQSILRNRFHYVRKKLQIPSRTPVRFLTIWNFSLWVPPWIQNKVQLVGIIQSGNQGLWFFMSDRPVSCHSTSLKESVPYEWVETGRNRLRIFS